MSETQQILITQSMMKSLRACPKLCKLTHLDGWRIRYVYDTLSDGILWHAIRAMGALCRTAQQIRRFIDESCGDDLGKAAKFKAMDAAWLAHYDRIIPHQGVEVTFVYPLINPDTNKQSRAGIITGKLDGLWCDPDGHWWIIEYKTSASIEDNYIERLVLDMQVHVYKRYAERMLGIKIVGVIYDVIKKPTIYITKGETEQEYQIRLAGLIAKSKNGKSQAKWQIPETPDEYADRVWQWYQDNAETAFYRERLMLQDLDIEAQCWMIYQELLWRRRHNCWPRNDLTCCNHYGRKCAFFQYCAGGDNPLVLEMEFDNVGPNTHTELQERMV